MLSKDRDSSSSGGLLGKISLPAVSILISASTLVALLWSQRRLRGEIRNLFNGCSKPPPPSIVQRSPSVLSPSSSSSNAPRPLPTPRVVPDDVDSTVEWSVRLTPQEVETMRSIFNLFDADSSGRISTRELQALHEKLGEPLTDEEAAMCMSEIDGVGKGYVSFGQFLGWWAHFHDDPKGSIYTKRFKLIRGKLESTDHFDIDRIVTRERGVKYSLEWRLDFLYKTEGGKLRPISPWHDIPLCRMHNNDHSGDIYHMVVEIPRYTRAKFECSTTENYNPIKQDTANGSLRYYKYGDIMFNYGFLPQTWENPAATPPDVGFPGDCDPLDAIELGSKQRKTGEVMAVKILGLIALIDSNECDWKILCLAIDDLLAQQINDIDDVDRYLPGSIDAIRTYFRDYKSASGQVNHYAFQGQAMPKHYAIDVIHETHQYWNKLHVVDKLSVVDKTKGKDAGVVEKKSGEK